MVTAGAEGFQRAIGKPFGRLRRGEIPQRLPPQRRKPQKAPSAEGAVSRRLTEDKPLKLAFIPEAVIPLFPHPHKKSDGLSAIGFFSFPQCCKVAAALSAAVTTTYPQETAPNSQAEPPKKKHTRQTPAALRERGVWRERRFSQRSGLSPQNLRPLPRLFGREREGGDFSSEKSPPSQNSIP